MGEGASLVRKTDRICFDGRVCVYFLLRLCALRELLFPCYLYRIRYTCPPEFPNYKGYCGLNETTLYCCQLVGSGWTVSVGRTCLVSAVGARRHDRFDLS